MATTDPETSVGASPLADVPPPLMAQLPRLIGLKYLTQVNRWTTVDLLPASLHRATGGDLLQSLLWRTLLRDHSIVDILSIVVPGPVRLLGVPGPMAGR